MREDLWLALAGALGGSAAADVKIAIDLSGGAASTGTMRAEDASFYIDAINAAGGIAAKRLALLRQQGQSAGIADPAQSTRRGRASIPQGNGSAVASHHQP
jgi:hypothetical protein